MNKRLKNRINIGNEKIGIGMIVSSLSVIIFTVGIFLYQQKNDDINEIHRQGTGLVRLLGSMPLTQLTGGGHTAGTLRLLQEAQVNQNFAFASVVNTEGLVLAEVIAPGMSVSPMLIPGQPSQWLGEREYKQASGITINEYFAPIMDKGELQAFIRLGYLEPSYQLNASQVRLLAILAMAIFMLTPIFYFMLKKEIRPLTSISTQLQALVKKTESVDTDVTSNSSTQDFMQKFGTVVEAAYNHIDALEDKQTNSVVSCKLLVYQKARLESALNALPCAIVVADESGQITYTSNNIHQLLGTQEGEVLGCNLTDFSDNRELSEYLVNCQAGNAVNVYQHDEADIYLAEVDKRVLVSPYPLYSHKNENQLLGTVIVFRDTTNEDIAHKHNGEFVAHVAHELKTPLNILFMYSETLLDNADASRELTIEAANVIHDETGRISQMIDNLLNLAMIEMGTVPIHRQRVKVGDLLKDIYQAMSRNLQNGDIEFELNIPHDLGTLSLDKDLVRVSINNLISNAIKYNRPGGKVELSAEENEMEIIIRVRDTGIGIAEQDQHRIYNKFFRSEDDEVRARSGHGLGLSLVYEAVKLHHGKIQLHSTPGEGSEFTLSFTKEDHMLKDVI
jgi:PAS domain S-box-containing protein